MDSRDLIRDEQDLTVLIDSQSIDNVFDAGNDKAKKILYYQQHDSFTFLRSPFDTSYELLSTVEEYEIESIPDEVVNLITYANTQSVFRYTDETIERKQNRLENDGYSLSENELRVVAVCRSLNDSLFNDSSSLFITENDTILKARLALESEFDDGNEVQLNIMSLEEAAEFLGLFMRYRDKFVFYPEEMNGGSMQYDFTAWCWTLSSIIVPHMGGIDGLGARLENLIIGVDELGYQYYMGCDNSTNMKMRYHFDHIVSLITGVFDSLAIHTRDEYDLDIENKRTTIRTGDDLFGKIREIDEELWHYIEENHHFVELIYALRPLIIHRDGVMGNVQEIVVDGSSWSSLYIALNDMEEEYRDEFETYYRHLDDELLDYDPLTKWGLICADDTMERLPEKHQLIEPYQFIKTALRTLLEFVDGYLEMLGCENNLNGEINETDTNPTALYIHQRDNVKRYMMSPLM